MANRIVKVIATPSFGCTCLRSARFYVGRGFLVWAALSRFRHVAIGHHYDFFKTPNVIAQASSHAGSDSQRLVDSGEIVIDGMDRNHRNVILDFLGKAFVSA